MNKIKKIISGLIFVGLTIFSAISLLQVQANDEDTRTLVIHYARYDNQTNWSVWLWSHEPVSKEGENFSFTSSDSYGQVLTIPIANTQFQDASKIGFLIRDAVWNKDIPIDRFFEVAVDAFDQNNELHLYLVQSTEEIFTNQADAASELSKYHIVGDYHYKLEDGVASLWRPTNVPTANTVINLPSSVVIAGVSYDVKAIGDFAFNNQFNVESVVFPNTIESIGKDAFSRTRIRVLSVPSSVKFISTNAFGNIARLHKIYLPSSITTIESDAFKQIFLRAVFFTDAEVKPSGWSSEMAPATTTMVFNQSSDFIQTNIDGLSFLIHGSDATLLGGTSTPSEAYDIEIPNTITHDGLTYDVTRIGLIAFQGDNHLRRVTIPSNVEVIENRAFLFANNLSMLTFAEESNLTNIQEYAFTYTKLTELVLPSGLNTIHSWGISFMDHLEYLYIPSTVKFVEENGLNFGTNSSPIVVVATEAQTNDWNPNWNPGTLGIFFGEKPVVIDYENIRYVIRDNEAHLHRIINPELVPEVLIIPSSVTSGVSYPVTSILRGGFVNGWKVRELRIPSSITNISPFSLINLGNLADFVVDAQNPSYSVVNGVLYNKSKDTLVHYPRIFSASSFTVPSSVVTIGDYAFYGNHRLRTLAFEADSNLKIIGDSAFYGSALRWLNLPEGVEELKPNAFRFSERLYSLFLPASLVHVGVNALDTANDIIISYPGSVIPESWLSTIQGNINFNVTSGVEPVIDNNLIYFVNAGEAYVIGYQHSPTSLTKLVLPESINVDGVAIPITVIASQAFSSENNITEIEFSSNIRVVSSRAFWFNHQLRKITFAENGNLTEIQQLAFAYNHNVLEVVIPSGVTKIEQSAFFYMDGLLSVFIPSSVSFVGSEAFRSSNDSSMIIGIETESQIIGWNNNWNPSNHEIYFGSNTLRIIDQDGFKFWLIGEFASLIGYQNSIVPNLLTIPSNITVDGESYTVNEIRSNIFNNVFNVRRIEIPSTVSVIQPQAFTGAYNLEHIHVDVDNEHYKDVDGVLFNSSGSVLLSFPARKIQPNYTIPDSVETIERSAFARNQLVRSIEFTESSKLSKIESYAFSNANISYMILPSGLTTIGQYAFEWMQGLTILYIPASVETMGNYVISSNTPATIYVEKSEEDVNTAWPMSWRSTWNTSVIYGFSSNIEILTQDDLRFLVVEGKANVIGFAVLPTTDVDLIIPNTVGDNIPVVEILASAFAENQRITSVSIPANVEIIHQRAFARSHQINSVTFSPNSNLRRLEWDVFFNAYNIREIILPDKLEHIGTGAFAYIGRLSNVRIPASVLRVDSGAFRTWEDGSRFATIIVATEEQTVNWDAAWNPQNFEVYYGDSVTFHQDEVFHYWIIDGEATITGFVQGVSIARPVFPSTIIVNDLEVPVTSIGSSAFSNNEQISNLVIPSFIKTIGIRAFEGNYRLEQLRFENDSLIETISAYAFRNTNISNVRIPRSLKVIGTEAFAGIGSLTTIEFENDSTLHTLGRGAFAWNHRITSLSLPASLEVIQPAGVSFIQNLMSISIPESNQYYKTIDGVLYSKDGSLLITYPGNRPERVFVVPASVERIDTEAFSRTRNLEVVEFEANSKLKSIGNHAFIWSSIKSITLPDGLERIEYYAFYDVNQMSYISIPDSVTYMGFRVFGGSPIQLYTSLTSIPLSWDNEWREDSVSVNLGQSVTLHTVNNMNFLIANDQATFLGITADFNETTIAIPSSITETQIPVVTIGNAALSRNHSITQVTIPNSVVTIQDQAFSQMRKLESVTFTSESHLEHIGRDAFSNTSIIEFRIPDSVKSIGSYAFAWNAHLSMVYIPLAVTNIEHDAFAGGNQQMLILVEAPAKPIGWNLYWMGWNSKAILWDMEYEILVRDHLRFVITRELEAKVVGAISDHPAHIIIPTFITENNFEYPVVGILNGAFSNNINITEVTIHSGVRDIHDNAFFRARNLSVVNIPSSGLINIGEAAFQETRLSEFTLPSSVTSIGHYAFSYMWQMETFTIPVDSVLETIGDGAFQWSSNLREIYIPELVSGLTLNPFRGVHQLAVIDVHPNNTNLYSQSGILFERHGNLVHIVAYANANGERTLVVPNNVSVIGQEAIRDAWSLEAIQFEQDSQLVEIKPWSIIGTNIRSIRFPSSLEKIGEHALAWNWNLQSVYIDSGVTFVDFYAFQGGNQGMEIFIKEESQLFTWNPNWNPNNKSVIFGDVREIEFEGYKYRVTPDSVMIIGPATGQLLESTVTIPSRINVDGEFMDVTAIGTAFLNHNSNVGSVIIPSTIERIQGGAFSYAYQLQSVIFDQSSGVSKLKTIGAGAFRGVGIETITIPSGVIRIDDEAFAGNYRMQSVVFEENSQLETIGAYAFAWNWDLRSFRVPASVIDMSPRALNGNGNLEKIDVDSNNIYYSSSSGVLFSHNGNRLIAYPSGKPDLDYQVPASVIVIEDYAFMNSRYLQSLTFEGTNVTTIGHQAFSGSNLRTITLPEGVLEIRNYAFAWNYNLVIVSIPQSANYLAYDLFNGTNENLIIFVAAETIPGSWDLNWNLAGRRVVFNSYIQTHTENDLEFIISNNEAMVFGASIGTNHSTITIPSSVTIGDNTVPVTSIASAAFMGREYVQSVSIPGSVRRIGTSAFANNYQLSGVIFTEESGLVEIGKRAFENTALTSFSLPKSVTHIDDFAFANNYSLKSLDLSSGVSLNRIGQFAFAWTGIQSLTIPSGVTIIDDYAFFNSYDLSNLVFAANSQLTTIGRYSFAWSYNLTSFEIPASVTLIRESAFRGNSQLVEYVVEPGNSRYSTIDGVLFNHDQTRLIAYPSAKITPNYVMPNSVIIIESDAFNNAYYLQEITLSNSLTTIRRNAFTYTSLSRITLPSSLIRIEDYAFFGNWLLREVVIPESVTHVGFHSFRHLNHNAVLRVQAAAIPSAWDTQWNPNRIFTVFGNEEIVTIDDFVYSISFDNVVTVIGLSDAGSGKSVLTVPSSITNNNLAVTKIGDNAFMNTTIETITLANSITSIGNSSFKNIFTLSGVILHPDSQLMTIGSEAFANSSLLSMTIPRSVTLIEEKAFENAYRLAQVIFAPDSQLTTINAHAFAWNPVITTYDLPNSLTFIAENAFSSNRLLTEITIDNDYYYSSGGVLFNAALTTLIHYPSAKADADYVIPSTVTRISPFAFRDSQFTTVTLPQGLTTVGDYAFFGNSGLVSITIPSSVTYMGNEVFNSSNSSLVTINNLAADNIELWHEDWNTKQ